MMTRDVVQTYFDQLKNGEPWSQHFADDVTFTSFTNPARSVTGKQPFLQAAQGFYGMIAGMEVRELMVDGDHACALTRYQLRPPNGSPVFSSDVAEIFTVKGEKIASFGIYFDPTPYPRR